MKPSLKHLWALILVTSGLLLSGLLEGTRQRQKQRATIGPGKSNTESRHTEGTAGPPSHKEDYPYQEHSEPTSPGLKVEQVHSKNRCTYPSKHEKDWLDYLTFGAAVVAALGGVAAACFTGWEASIAKQQLRAAQTQLDIMGKQFLASHRPWVEAQISIDKPITFYGDHAEVGLSIKIKNGGTAPAIGADPMFDLVMVGAAVAHAPDTGESYVVNRQNIWCSPERVDALIKAGKLRGLVKLLLPNSEVTQLEMLHSGKQEWQLAPTGDVYKALITGCVLYADEFGASHATSITLHLMTSYPFKPKAGLTVKVGNWIPAPYGHNAY